MAPAYSSDRRPVARFAAGVALPMPWPYLWAYRLGKRFELPVIRRLDPERPSFSVRVPRPDRRRG